VPRGDRQPARQDRIKVAITQLQWPQWLSEVFKERNYDLTIVPILRPTTWIAMPATATTGYDSPEFKAKWREVVAATDFAKRDALLKTRSASSPAMR